MSSSASRPHSRPDVALIQEALEYQEDNSLQGPLFPEAQEELRRLEEQYEALASEAPHLWASVKNSQRRANKAEADLAAKNLALGDLQEQLEAVREEAALSAMALNGMEEQFEALRYAAHHFVMHSESDLAFDALVDALPPGVPNPASRPLPREMAEHFDGTEAQTKAYERLREHDPASEQEPS